MIVSHEHRFIFVKTRKTAGTSIEALLAQHLGLDAIVTPIEHPVAGHTPCNFERPASRAAELRGWMTKEGRRDLRRHRWFYNHIPARLIRERVGPKIWDSYYKFTFERNPWDKTISWYYYRARNINDPRPFADYVHSEYLPSDWAKYSLNGELAVDFVGRYESLDDDLRTAMRSIGLPEHTALTNEKGGLRPTVAAPEAMYDDAAAARVATVFAREIEAFGYTRP